MKFLLSHWHCLLSVIAVAVAMFFMRDKDKEKKTKDDHGYHTVISQDNKD